MLLKIKCQPSRNAQIDQLGTRIPCCVECSNEHYSKASASASPVSECLDGMRMSTSTHAHLAELSPVQAIKTIVCSRGKDKKMASDLTNREDLSMKEESMNKRKRWQYQRTWNSREECLCVPSNC
jgi:hypothetical protein